MFAFLPAMLLSLIVTANPAAALPAAKALPDRVVQTYQRLVFRRTTSIARAARAEAALPIIDSRFAAFDVKQREERDSDRDAVRPAASGPLAAAAASVPIPNVVGRGVAAPDTGFSGFPGLTHLDQRESGSGPYANTNFSLEPPDQGLCVGNGYVMEPINDALAVYTQYGAPLTGPVSLSQFFGLAPEIIRPLALYGPFIGDPKCLFDRDTQRWFVTELVIDTNPTTGARIGPSSLIIAISQTSSPLGNYNVFSIDTTDYSNPGCPCFGDQPLIGADANGFYMSTNEFSLANPNFNGTQLYAFSKAALALGNLPPVVHLNVGSLPTPDLGGQWYSVQPATSPSLRSGQNLHNGTEYFLSALDFFNRNDDRVAVWSLGNTASLWSLHPNLTLQHTIVRTEAYGAPPPATQKNGEKPLGQSLHEPAELLNTNDDRMNQVVYANGLLWAGVNTAVRVSGRVRSGTAYFAVRPVPGAAFSADLAGEGYVAVEGNNALFPSIGVNSAGKPVLACSISGTDFYPSAAYVPLTAPNLPVRVAGTGVLPDDGFTAYAAYGGGGVARWGDYSAAVADEYGNLWFAAEYIPGTPRTLLANWGTFVGELPGS